MTAVPTTMTQGNEADNQKECLVCESNQLSKIEEFDELPRITSDCRDFPKGGELFVCLKCGTVQKQPNKEWLVEIEKIYAEYASYYQSDGEEQVVFDKTTGQIGRRSDVLMDKIKANTRLPVKGAALDIGCGHGVTLRSMETRFTHWALYGFEIGDATIDRLKRISQFKELYTGSLKNIKRSFDIVTMIHSLEHFPSPSNTLRHLANIVGNGTLFIEVSNIEQNPFDILIGDHLIHFSPFTLSYLLYRNGFQTSKSALDWVPKEISMLAQYNGNGPTINAPPSFSGQKVYDKINGYVRWLRKLTQAGQRLANSKNTLGIFGTSIAATWLGTQLENSVKFYVDEDESRVGRLHLNKPIVRPEDVSRDSIVFLALAPMVADLIYKKLSGAPFQLVLPPALGGDIVP